MKILIANIPTQIPLGNGKEKYFIKAGSRWPFSLCKKREEPMIGGYLPFPFYLAYTSALLKKNNFNVYSIDCVALNYSEEDFIKKFQDIFPDVIVIESQTPTIKYDLEMISKMKKINKKLRVILAGPHPTVFAKQILKEYKDVDIILLREYEFSCLEVMKSDFKVSKMEKIKGVAFRKGNRIIFNEAELVDVDKLPFPDRDSFPLPEKPDPSIYHDFERFKPSVQMHASRGCPFRCNFCLWNQVMYLNKSYRPRDPKNIVDEIEYCIKKYNVKEVYFDDDTFTGNKQHVLEFCKEIRKRKLKIKWSCMGDAMITDKEMIHEMYKAGCIGIKFGVESGNKKILKNIEKPINFSRIIKFLEECSKRHIKTHATFTFGIMGETRRTMQQTLDMAKKLDVDSVQFSITTPFPGTRYFDKMEKEGKILSKNWEDYDGSSKSIVDFGELSGKEVEDFCGKAKERWLQHKKKDLRWVKRQIIFTLQSSFNQGPRFFLNKTKKFIRLFK